MAVVNLKFISGWQSLSRPKNHAQAQKRARTNYNYGIRKSPSDPFIFEDYTLVTAWLVYVFACLQGGYGVNIPEIKLFIQYLYTDFTLILLKTHLI